MDWNLTIQLLTVLLLTVGAAKAIKELIRAQRWKQAEYLANEYKVFTENNYVKAASTILDGFSLNLTYLDQEGKRAVIIFEKEKLKNALTNIHINKPNNRAYSTTAELVYIRLCIDSFLFKLGAFQIYLDNKLIEKKMLKPYVIYWIELLMSTEEDIIDNGTKKIIYQYIADNKIYSVIKLFRTFGFIIPYTNTITVQ